MNGRKSKALRRAAAAAREALAAAQAASPVTATAPPVVRPPLATANYRPPPPVRCGDFPGRANNVRRQLRAAAPAERRADEAARRQAWSRKEAARLAAEAAR